MRYGDEESLSKGYTKDTEAPGIRTLDLRVM